MSAAAAGGARPRKSTARHIRRQALPEHPGSAKPARTNSLGRSPRDCHRCSESNWKCDGTRPFCNTCTANGFRCNGYPQDLVWQSGVASRGKWKDIQFTVDSTPASQQARNDVAQPEAYLFVHEQDQGEKPRQTKTETKRKRQQSLKKASAKNQKESDDDDDAGHGLIARRDNTAINNTRSLLLRLASSSMKLPPNMSPLHPVTQDTGDLLQFYQLGFARATVTCDISVNPWQCSLAMVHSMQFLMYAVKALSRLHRAHCKNKSDDAEVGKLKGLALSSFRMGMLSMKAPSEALVATALTLIGLEYTDSAFSNWTTHLRGVYKILETTNGLHIADSNPTLRSHIAQLLWYDITAALLSRAGPVFPQRYLDVVLTWSAKFPREWSYMSLNGCPDSLLPIMYKLAAWAPLADDMSSSDRRELGECISRLVTDSSVNVDDDPALPSPSPPPLTPSPTQSAIGIENNEMPTGKPQSYMSAYFYLSVSDEKPTDVTVEASAIYDMHLKKCWRLSMLLYLHQVFYRANDNAANPEEEEEERQIANKRRMLSRTIIGLISEMPSSSNWQKQSLLPVVLSGFELRQECPSSAANAGTRGVGSVPSENSTVSLDPETLSLREWVESYCLRWNKSTGVWIFGTARELLVRLWARMDSTTVSVAQTTSTQSAPPVSTDTGNASYKPHGAPLPQTPANSVWWGDMVDEDSRANSDQVHRIERGYLFG